MRYRFRSQGDGSTAVSRIIDAGPDRYVRASGPLKLYFSGVPGQGISWELGEENGPYVFPFSVEVTLTIPEVPPQSFAWLAAFSSGETLEQNGEAATLVAGWTTTGDLRVTLYGEGPLHWRRLTVEGHVAAYAGRVLDIKIERTKEGGLGVFQRNPESADWIELEGTESTNGNAPDWTGEIAATWLHVCGAQDQDELSAGYIGSIYAVEYETSSFRNEAVLWLDAAHVDSDSAPQALVNRGGAKGTVGDAQFGSTNSADTNDPLWLTGSGYVYLPGVSGNYISTPDSEDLDVTTSVRVVMRLAMSDWTPPVGAARVIGKYRAQSGERSWMFGVIGAGGSPAGGLGWIWSPDGESAVTAVSTAALPVSDGDALWLHSQLTLSNGSGVWQATFEYSTDGQSWTTLGSTVTGGTSTAIHTSSSVLSVGIGDVTSVSYPCKVYYAEVHVDGALVARFDASQCGQTGYTDAINSTVWAVNRATSGRKTVVKDTDEPLLLFGGDDFLEIAHNEALNFGTNPFTIALLQRTHGSKAAQIRIAKCAVISNPSYPGWHMHSFSGTPTSGAFQTIASGDLGLSSNIANSPESGVRGMLSAVRDETGYTYHDGERSGSKIATVHNCDNELPVRIARISGGGGNYGEFEFFGAAIFRRALTDAELVALEREMLWELEHGAITTPGAVALEADFSTPSSELADLSGNNIVGHVSADLIEATRVIWKPRRRRVFEGAWWDAQGDPHFILPQRLAPSIHVNGSWFPPPEPEPDHSFTLSASMVPRVESGGSPETLPADEYGRILQVTTGAVSVTDYQITAAFADPEGAAPLSWQSSDPAIATVDAQGYVTGRAAGTVTITATSEAGASDEIELTIEVTPDSTVVDHVGWEEGSLMEHMDSQIRSRISGKTPTTSKPLFTVADHAAGIYVANPDCWAADLDWTSMAIARLPYGASTWLTSLCATAITDWHVVLAGHAMLGVGTKVRFPTVSGGFVDRTIVKTKRHPSYANLYPDIGVGLLDEPLLSGEVNPAKIFPDDVTDYLPLIGALQVAPVGHDPGRGLPVLAMDQENKALVHAWTYEGEFGGSGELLDILHIGAANSLLYDSGGFAAFAEAKVGGDSARPNYAVADDELVLLGVTTNAGGGSCTACSLHAADLNSLIAAVDSDAGVSTGRTVSTKNINSFKNYA